MTLGHARALLSTEKILYSHAVFLVSEFKGRYTLGDKLQQQVAATDHSVCSGSATSCNNMSLRHIAVGTSQRQIASCVLGKFLSLQQNFVAATSRTNSVRFDFLHHVAETKMFTKFLHYTRSKRFVGETCRRDMLLQLVAKCVTTLKLSIVMLWDHSPFLGTESFFRSQKRWVIHALLFHYSANISNSCTPFARMQITFIYITSSEIAGSYISKRWGIYFCEVLRLMHLIQTLEVSVWISNHRLSVRPRQLSGKTQKLQKLILTVLRQNFHSSCS